ncbi:hypothetical protein Nepgr_022173 [Nepenthes gracilis]|uniref:DNA 3'-5' helicase n=1 Tax=Nepenthes gracilis TaxID=150966 RepID=A0AAD3T0E6_NEPGR|nr:hypothetical protein Nepgr_022173 [Nepenthes gracilis]
MALMALAVHSCAKCFRKRGLKNAVAFEVGGDFHCKLSLGSKMSSSKLLISKFYKSSRSKHKFAEKLLEEPDNYGPARVWNRSKLLKKVSFSVGYDDHHGLIEDRSIRKDQGLNLKDLDDNFHVSLGCKKFPSIIMGSSPQVELYDNSDWHSRIRSYSVDQSCNELVPNGKPLDTDGLSEKRPCVYPCIPSVSSSTVRKVNGFILPSQSQLHVLESSAFMVCEDDTSTKLILDKPISCIAGLSKRNWHKLEDSDFHTLRKLLHHFPRTYADLQNPHVGIEDGHYLILAGRIFASKAVRLSCSLSFLEVVVGGEIVHHDSSSECKVDDIAGGGKKVIYLHLKKFFRGTRFTNQPFLRSLQQKHKEGDIVCVSGKVRSMPTENHYEIREYCLDVIDNAQDSSVCVKGRSYPIYPSKGGLKPQFLRDMITRALHSLPTNVDPIPKDITEDLGLPHLHEAYIGIHQPKDLSEADLARKRFIFDEFFYLQLGRLYQMLEGLGSRVEKEGLLEKYRNPELHAVISEQWSSLAKGFMKSLPYSLTSSQLSAVCEIIWDLKRPVPMNRLLQGDVGCGKTVVAFLACLEVLGSGYQAAFMVPTELLAVQHYEHLHNLLDNMESSDCRPPVALLTGSTPTKEARMIRQGLQTGDISLVIGTHSLIAEKVEFSALRLAVIDEQHRFGVIQRGRFNSKLFYPSSIAYMASPTDASKGDLQMAPHVLALSATPIPRTLALALYGDMSLTQITDLPPGRSPIDTHIVEGNDTGFEMVYQMMMDELQAGGKVFLVYPIIEQSEQLPQLRAVSADFKSIQTRFPGYKCSLLHGKMKSDEKDEALRQFRHGQTHILLSTQVIEIGVDVPDASMMVVMNAERFGIAQLHQLRGRVGRGSRKSKCILLGSTSSSLSRLKVLEHSSDGFDLAKVDLLLRGPGDLLGKKQSGHLPEFPIARLEVDGNILQDAHVAALKILGMSHDLKQFPMLKAELSMRQPLSILGD